jgi:hypothetical protein
MDVTAVAVIALASSAAAVAIAIIHIVATYIWTQQQRSFVDRLMAAFDHCENRLAETREELEKVHVSLHKAISTSTTYETQNMLYGQQHRADQDRIVALQRELDQALAAQAGRQLTRREDDER